MIYLENKLLLISITFTPKTSHSCLKRWYTMFSRQLLFECLDSNGFFSNKNLVDMRCLSLKHFGLRFGKLQNFGRPDTNTIWGCYRTALMLGINEPKNPQLIPISMAGFLFSMVFAFSWGMDASHVYVLHRFHAFLSSGKSSANRQFLWM